MKRLLLLTIIAFALHLLDGCAGGSSTPPPPVATHLSVSSSTTTAMVGAAVNITVRALDASGAVVSNYSDTVHFTSTDGQAVLPTNSTLTNGTGTFSATLKTTGGQTITATDTLTASITGSSNSINVATNATHFSLTAPATATIGTPFNFSVTALDASNNVVPSYSGTAHFTSTDSQAVLPANSTLTNGTGTFSATLKTTGGQTITATDTVTASITGTSKNINAAAASMTISSNAPPQGALQNSYGGSNAGFALSAVGGVPPYSWSWAAASGSALPPGLSLSGGIISGTPTTAGSYNVIVTVADSESPAAKMTANYAIVINGQHQSSLAISSSTPPGGIVGTPYNRKITGYCQPVGHACYPCFPGASTRSCGGGYRTLYSSGFTLSANGGAQPFSWKWAPQPNSPVPSGLDLSAEGIISGTPTSGGSFNITVTVTDSESPAAQASNNYTVVINDPQIPAINTTPSPSAGAVNLPYQYSFTATGGSTSLAWSETGNLPPGLIFTNNGELSGVPTVTGAFPITISTQDSAGHTATPQDFTIQVYSHGFKTTGSMETARTEHTATLLSDGKVLVAGGYTSSGGLATTELFEPSSGSFSSTGSMEATRFGHTATLLCDLSSVLCKDQRVLVTGGNTITAELFDPADGSFTPTGSMEALRSFHTATLLNNGKVLITGGRDDNDNPVSTAQLFDSPTGTFVATGSMSSARYGHTATLLKDGKVLITGGLGSSGNSIGTAELYDPSTGIFTPTGNLGMERYTQTATLLTNGKVLVAGGFGRDGTPVATAELFDPSSGSFALAGNMESARSFHAATLLKDGTVLVAGGEDANRNYLSSAELFDPYSGTFSPTGSMGTPRFTPTITMLQNGAVLVIGGIDASGTAELYQ